MYTSQNSDTHIVMSVIENITYYDMMFTLKYAFRYNPSDQCDASCSSPYLRLKINLIFCADSLSYNEVLYAHQTTQANQITSIGVLSSQSSVLL